MHWAHIGLWAVEGFHAGYWLLMGLALSCGGLASVMYALALHTGLMLYWLLVAECPLIPLEAALAKLAGTQRLLGKLRASLPVSTATINTGWTVVGLLVFLGLIWKFLRLRTTVRKDLGIGG